jgi:hypothetical protein
MQDVVASTLQFSMKSGRQLPVPRNGAIMSVELPNSRHVLLFGKDANLLELRAMVLRTVGITVEIAVDIVDLKAQVVASGSICNAIICCHSATEAEYNEVIVIANQKGLALLKLANLVAPRALIDEVSTLIGAGRPKLNTANSDPSR